ncbi:MAG: hypothetical protein KAJ39_01285 [Gammaproteobacteria bacterium]|nr:hypothetical protein [Gammaproteobacteria bacterium]
MDIKAASYRDAITNKINAEKDMKAINMLISHNIIQIISFAIIFSQCSKHSPVSILPPEHDMG